ncbi:MAG: membrane protein insertion efficiency factor YidD [Chlorobiales bacterium]|nr:membrane protein insertion efficiency factor YidD [Chlorobiales bacterium]
MSLIWKVINSLPILLIRFYQVALSPLFPPSCRFVPSCSNYALEAYRTHNFFYATWLTVWRVLRCNPFVKGGYDPVPPPKPNGS